VSTYVTPSLRIGETTGHKYAASANRAVALIHGGIPVWVPDAIVAYDTLKDLAGEVWTRRHFKNLGILEDADQNS